MNLCFFCVCLPLRQARRCRRSETRSRDRRRRERHLPTPSLFLQAKFRRTARRHFCPIRYQVHSPGCCPAHLRRCRMLSQSVRFSPPPDRNPRWRTARKLPRCRHHSRCPRRATRTAHFCPTERLYPHRTLPFRFRSCPNRYRFHSYRVSHLSSFCADVSKNVGKTGVLLSDIFYMKIYFYFTTTQRRFQPKNKK